jgi:hypothetical protein
MSTGSLVAIQLAKPEWIGKMPASAQAQGIALASLVVFGAALQWALLPRNERQGEGNPGAPAGPPRPLVRDLRDLNRAPAMPPGAPPARPAPVPPLKMTYSLKEASR